MKIKDLLNSYDTLSVDLSDLLRWMRRWECPQLTVIEKVLPEEVKQVEAFSKKDISPTTGGANGRLHENIVEYFSNDENETEFSPIIPQKFVAFEKIDYSPGMCKITLMYGQKKRKENDYRFVDKINVKKDESYFLYDYNLKYYKQVNPEKKQWVDRYKEREEIRREAIQFINYYHDLKNAIWIKKRNPLDKNIIYYTYSNEIEGMTKIRFLETMLFFLKLSKKYCYILWFFGSICIDEYATIKEAIDSEIERILKNFDYIILEEEGLLHELKETMAVPDQDPFYDTKYYLGLILTPRKEKIDDIDVYNYFHGYVKISKKGCFPNIGEIYRRCNLFEAASNADSEREIQKRIIEIALTTKKQN